MQHIWNRRNTSREIQLSGQLEYFITHWSCRESLSLPWSNWREGEGYDPALREARLTQGLSLYALAFDLSLSVHVLEAIEAEALRIAKGKVDVVLYKRGQSIAQIGKGVYDSMVAGVAMWEETRMEATRRIDVLQSLARDAHEELMSEGE